MSRSDRWCHASPKLGAMPARRFSFSPVLAATQHPGQVRQRLGVLAELEAPPEGVLRLLGLRDA